MSSWKFFVAAAMVASLAASEPAHGKTTKPAKAYLVAEIEVTDTEAYKAYAAKAGPVITACGGTYLARGGKVEGLEGAAPAPRFVIVAFKDLETAKACYLSPAYQAVAPLRQKASKSRFWLSEGLPGQR